MNAQGGSQTTGRLTAPTAARGGVAHDPISMTWPQYLRRECTFHGSRVHLTPSQLAMFSVLLANRGRTVSNEELIEALYPDPWEAPEWDATTMKVLLGLMRRKLPGLISLDWGRGYFIERPITLELAKAA